MEPERITIGTTVRVREHHRIAERRGMVGRVVDRYGGDGDMIVDVCFSDRLRWLLWPEDLEEISSPQAVVAFANRPWLAGDESNQEEDDRSGGAPHQTSAPVIRQAAETDADISKDGELQTARLWRTRFEHVKAKQFAERHRWEGG
jgi:hypothetical protein